MDNETAEKLTAALNRFSDVLEKLQGGQIGGGLHIYHHGMAPAYPQPFPGFNPHYPLAPYSAAMGGN